MTVKLVTLKLIYIQMYFTIVVVMDYFTQNRADYVDNIEGQKVRGK